MRGTLIVFWNTYDMALPAYSFPRARAQIKLCKPADSTRDYKNYLRAEQARQQAQQEQPPATNLQLPYLFSIINSNS